MSGNSLIIIIPLLEILIYCLVVYVLTSRTYGRDSLRWKTATIISTFFGLLLFLGPVVFIFIHNLLELKGTQWAQENTESLQSAAEGAMVIFIVFSLPIMFAIILRIYIMTANPPGSRWVEYFWENPQLHDKDEGRRPPYLARFFQKRFEASYRKSER
jgi:energy-coupling factor transporter transmembrane protein EcfT